MKSVAVLCCLLSLLFTSCGDREQKSPFMRGMLLSTKDTNAAENAFLQAIAQEDNLTQACLEYAELCAKQPEKYGIAIFYYNKFLALEPEAVNVDEVKKNIALLERRLAIKLNQKIGEDALDENSLRIKLLEQHTLRQKQWIEELNEENQKLRRQLAEQQ